ncbi:uncharacterized protein LOC132727857 [Ruditapes philippinarum]|uniref:uncharacterized protein LOC132727857 n=1 Tax=Ruditapes philippinarum TaxID=129788 RepID=UPI00295C07D8|nr:uncharacterized protein LOC132727857 [Ruditapes philippinarum]
MSGVKQLIVLLLFRICVATVSYHESVTWDKANDTCTLATPEFIYDGEIFTVKEDQNITNDMDGRWLGYFRNMRGFEYFGCINYPGMFRIPSKRIGNNSPGNCFSVCSGNGIFVGLMSQECYCFKTITAEEKVVSYASCNKSCPPPSEGLACGGQSFISLYVINKKVLHIHKVFESGPNENKSNCIRLGGDNNILWDNCDGSLHSICENEPIVGNDHLEYGYLKRSDASERYEIQFTSNIQERKKSLCKGDIQTPKEQRQTDDGDDSGAAAVAAGVSVAGVIVIAAVVVFIILRKRKKTPSVLCCKTTARNQNLDNEHGKQEHVDKERGESNVYASPHHGFADPNIEVSSMENSLPHTYFVLEKTGKETYNANGIYNVVGPINCSDVENQQNNYDRRRKLGEHATYDRVQNAQVGMKNNEYDTTETVAAKLNMHTSPKGETHDCQEAEGDTYNHINDDLAKQIKTDNVYGTQADECSGEGYSSKQKTPAVEEDNYSHIHNSKLGKPKTDNVYGIH